MNILTVFLQTNSAPAANPNANGWSFWIMMIVIFAIMYFFMIRPQNKKRKEIEQFRNNLQVGQEVITASGMYGKIKSIEATFVILEIADGVKVKLDKGAIYANAADTQQR